LERLFIPRAVGFHWQEDRLIFVNSLYSNESKPKFAHPYYVLSPHANLTIASFKWWLCTFKSWLYRGLQKLSAVYRVSTAKLCPLGEY
ncbi:hypothetical protein N7522_004557, partial [Penicillium canescens]